MKLHLHRLGADPELLVGQVSRENERQVDNAQTTLFGGHSALGSFIGHDGHPATAELRPPPSRHVSMLLYHLAQGVLTIHAALQRRRPPGTILARPTVEGEVLGGHIHLSLYPQVPEIQRVLWADYGAYVDVSGELVGERAIPPALANEATVRRADLFNLRDFMHRMNWLLLPLEFWAQPWVSRRQRNQRYGSVYDVRMVPHPVNRWPMKSLADKYPYMHLEYRPPSTWLAHPRLAYLYLALAKLVILNYDDIPTERIDWSWSRAPTPANDMARDMLMNRWASRRWRTSADLRAIDENLRWLVEARTALWGRAHDVDIDEWAKLWGGHVDLALPLVDEDDPEAPPPVPPAPGDPPGDDDMDLADYDDDDGAGDDGTDYVDDPIDSPEYDEPPPAPADPGPRLVGATLTAQAPTGATWLTPGNYRVFTNLPPDTIWRQAR